MPLKDENAATIVYSAGRFKARIFKYGRLCWSHRAAILFLQGATVQKVLGPAWIILGGTSVAVWDPRPGLKDVVVAAVMENDAQLMAEQLFLELRAALKL